MEAALPTIAQWLAKSRKALAAVSESPRLDAEVLLAQVLQQDRGYLFTWPERELSPPQFEQAQGYLERRKTGEPVAYILGEREFWSLPLYCDASTLIPRPDTEVLVELVLALLPENTQRILDLGTGTGALALALAYECKNCQVDAVDFSSSAVALAEKNRQRLGLTNVRCMQSDWFSSAEGIYEVIVANPPYIDKQDSHLTQGDVAFEPRSALVADDSGLADLQRIIACAPKFLAEGGLLALEHGYTQAPEVRDLFQRNGYKEVNTKKDYGGNDRVTYGFK